MASNKSRLASHSHQAQPIITPVFMATTFREANLRRRMGSGRVLYPPWPRAEILKRRGSPCRHRANILLRKINKPAGDNNRQLM